MITYYELLSADEIRKDSIEQSMHELTVAEIKQLITRFDLPIKKSVRKDILIENVTGFLLAFPQKILNRLEAHEIIVLRKLLDGEKVIGNCHVFYKFYTLVRLGCIAMREIGDVDEACELVLLHEADKLFRPLMESYSMTSMTKIFQVVAGWSALCGILPINDIVKFLKKQPGFEYATHETLMMVFSHFGCSDDLFFESLFNSGEGELTYISPWSTIVGKCSTLLYREVRDKDGKPVKSAAYSPKEFSIEEIIEASIPLFAPVTPNKDARRNLERVCRELGMTDVATQQLLLDAWIEKQQDKETFDVGPLLERFLANSIYDVNKAMSAITEYMNTLPFWRFLGVSSRELAIQQARQSNRPPRIVAGPNMRAMGMEVPPEAQEMLNNAWHAWRDNESPHNDIKGSKPGRNDPCPCGSGKKYKKCCGK